MGRVTETVKVIIIINILFFVGSLITNSSDLFAVWYPENPNYGAWQILTHMFMHSQTFYLHIIFNMLGVWMFGSPLEQIWGRNKFLFFYFSAGLGAYVFSLGIDYFSFNSSLQTLVEAGFHKSQILDLLKESRYDLRWEGVLGVEGTQKFTSIFTNGSLGASGALMGLLVAFGMLFPEAKLMLMFLPIPIKAKYFIPVLVLYDIISGFTGGASVFGVNIAHWAHVGGALTGLIIALVWKKNSFNDKRWY